MLRFLFRFTLPALLVSILATACSSSSSGDPEASDPIPQNTQKATPESIASGKRVYERFCIGCHGPRGDGVGAVEMEMVAAQRLAADLTDDNWEYGSTDGEIYLNIRNGLGPKSSMRGINGKPGIYPQEIWDTVNYVRTLRKAPEGSGPAASSK
ncbi:MAG TPA: cytochrome c [Terriglobia bacterium]|nr:cytochrome c [Terriglobia bacterium]